LILYLEFVIARALSFLFIIVNPFVGSTFGETERLMNLY
jgi:hypothetical protein